MTIGERVRAVAGVPILLLALALWPRTANAQQADQAMDSQTIRGPAGLSIDVRGGLGLASGALAKLTGGAGTYAGGGLAYHITPIVALRGDVSAEFLDQGQVGPPPSGITMPPMRLINFGGGFEFDFRQSDLDKPPLVGMLFIGAGVTNVHASSGFLPVGPVTDSVSNFNKTYLSFHGGLGFGYQATQILTLFIRAETYVVFARDADTAVFSEVAPALGKFNRFWEHPLSVGVSLSTR